MRDDFKCETCGDWVRDCICEMCESCGETLREGTATECDGCDVTLCESCAEDGHCASRCDRCGEPSHNLKWARPDDWNAPLWCETCRAATFTARDIMGALTRDIPDVVTEWVDMRGECFNVCAMIRDLGGDVIYVVRIVDDWEREDLDASSACVGVILEDAMTGDAFAPAAWAPSWKTHGAHGDAVYVESVADVVALVRMARAYVDPDACDLCGETIPDYREAFVYRVVIRGVARDVARVCESGCAERLDSQTCEDVARAFGKGARR